MNAPTETTLVHDTGAWQNLLIKTNGRYPTIRGQVIYFVDQATKEKIDSALTFFEMVKNTKPNNQDQIVLDLAIKIEGMLDLELYNQLLCLRIESLIII